MLRKLIIFYMTTGLFLSTGLWATSEKNKKESTCQTVFERNVGAPGKIIFITGSCSSGKSSIARVLAEKLHAKSYAFDEYVMPLVLKKFVVKHYGRFLAFFINGWVARNFFKLITLLSDKQKYRMQIKFYNDLKEGMAIEPTSKMYREVREMAQKGHNVVVESPIYLWNGVDCLTSLKELKGTNITYVLAYCPWSELVNRIKQRNASSNKKIHRELDWALINYIDNFEAKTSKQGKDHIDCLNGESVHSVIDEYAQNKYKKAHMCLLSETKNLAYAKFPEDIDYYIYPRFTYDLTVNTKRYQPEEGAGVILEYLNHKKTSAQTSTTMIAQPAV